MPRNKAAKSRRSAGKKPAVSAAPRADSQAAAKQRRRRPQRRRESHRLAALARILETFTETLDLDEVLRRVVTITLEELETDRAWLLYSPDLDAGYANLTYEAFRPPYEGVFAPGVPIPLTDSQKLIERALVTPRPIPVYQDDPDMDADLHRRFQIRSMLLQVLRTASSGLWIFGLHQCSHARVWTSEEVDLFEEIGRYATLSIHNAEMHRRAVVEGAKVNAILDQIPEAAAIFDRHARLLRMNDAALRERAYMFELSPDERLATNRPRYLDGTPLRREELPSLRALKGEVVKSDYLFLDSRSGEDRTFSVRAAPVRDLDGTIAGSVVLATDVTEERQQVEQDTWRRRRAECLASLSMITERGELADMNAAAGQLAEAISGNAQIFIYRAAADQLELVGSAFTTAGGQRFREYIAAHPFRPGEGLPGTVFALGKPLLFSEAAETLTDLRRSGEEAELAGALHEESLIAQPIYSYGEPVGVIVLSHQDPRRRFGAEELAFAQTVAERIGSAYHVLHLTRLAKEGHRAAEELARREVDARARLEAVLDSAPIGIAVISADELRFEMANPLWIEFAARYGKIRSDDRIVALGVAEVVPRLERELQMVAERGVARSDDELEVSERFQTSYYKRIISPVAGRLSGTTQSLTVLVQDVTEQVRTRREIEALMQLMEERTARLDSIIGSMTDALWVYDAAHNVIDVNPAALAMFGLASRSDAVAHGSLRQLQLRYSDGRPIPPEDLPHARALRGEVVPDYIAVARHLITGRDIDLSIAAAPIQSGGVVGAVLVMRDITALQELDRKKDEFLSVASHELRTPLTTVKGYTQLLTQIGNDIDPEERLLHLRAILGEIDRMMGLISELLDVSRIETNRLMLDLQPTRWVELIERQASAFRLQFPKRRIVLNIAGPDVVVEVDPLRMRQVIDNLLSNAIKYSPEATDIEIEVAQVDGLVRTSVTDRGIGIPQDELPQLFERFHRARNVSSRYYGGLGLGLYIARAIVEAHGGKVTVVSEEGKGSTFTISIPLRAAPEPQTARPASELSRAT